MKYNNIIYSQREPNYTDLWIKPDNSLHMFNNGAWKQIAGKGDISEVDLSGFVTKDDNPLYTTNISDGDIITGTTDVDFLHITKHDNQLGFGVNNATYNYWWKNTNLANMVKISDGGGLINLEFFYCASTTYDDLKKANGWNLVPSNSLYAILEDYKNEVSNIPVITKVDAIPNTIISNITGNTDAPGEGFTLNITGTSIASDNIGRETESSITIPVASSSADGLLSSHDKGIIDAIPGTIVSKIINEKVNEELRISLTTRDINDGAWSARTEDIIIPYGQSTYNIGVINRDTDLVANETGVIYTNSMSISSETVDINQYNNILVKLTVPEGTLPVVCNLSGIGMTKRIFKSPDLYLNYGGVETRADLTITFTINDAEIIADFELVYYSGTGS